jgi:hypothetical protein
MLSREPPTNGCSQAKDYGTKPGVWKPAWKPEAPVKEGLSFAGVSGFEGLVSSS